MSNVQHVITLIEKKYNGKVDNNLSLDIWNEYMSHIGDKYSKNDISWLMAMEICLLRQKLKEAKCSSIL